MEYISRAVNAKGSQAGTPVALDLFSGCGGFSMGAEAAGVRVVAAFDSYPRCVIAHAHNHEALGTRVYQRDLSKATGAELLADAGHRRIDLIMGGPPCQSFSIRGKRLGLADTRGKLIFDFARIVAEIGPAAFIFENVPNLASPALRPVFEELLREFHEAGYTCSYAVLTAADFGVAQNRRRLFVLGCASGTRIRPPVGTHSAAPRPGKFVHLGTATVLDDLPDVGTDAAMRIPNHEPTAHTPEMLAAFRRLLPGKRDPKSHHDRLRSDRPGYTLRAGVGNFTPLRPIHYRHDRVISVRESARLQGFPDAFTWPDSVPRLQQYRQVGNAVPPPVAAAVVRAIGEQLGWRLAPRSMAFPGADAWVRWETKHPELKQQLCLMDLHHG